MKYIERNELGMVKKVISGFGLIDNKRCKRFRERNFKIHVKKMRERLGS